jgi:hypothetical protein
MKKVSIISFVFLFVFLSCDNSTEIDDSIEVKKAVPNPIAVGDTLSILLININIPLNIQNIEQVKLLLYHNSKIYTYKASGYYNYLEKQEYGNFNHSKLIDSLAGGYQPIVQCLVDSSFPEQSKIGIQLNEKILNSNIILYVNK